MSISIVEIKPFYFIIKKIRGYRCCFVVFLSWGCLCEVNLNFLCW
jgi:hypothetical protein